MVSPPTTPTQIPAWRRQPFQPQELFYMTSLRCNERCSKCSHWRMSGHSITIPPEWVVEVVHTVPSINSLCIVGGEPLLFRSQVSAIIAGLASTNVRTTILTNGLPCDPSFVATLVGRNVHLVFSIDTLDPIKWAWIRGTASQQKVMWNLEHVRDVLQPEQLSVQSVLAKETEEDVREVGRWCADRSIYHSVQLYLDAGFGGSWTPLPQAPQVYDLPPTSTSHCRAAGRNLTIHPDGSVTTCFQQGWIPSSGEPLGRLGTSSIEEILASAYTREVVNRMFDCELPCKVLKCNQ